jgi:drug/metabolite transporter (DMT)-like permease
MNYFVAVAVIIAFLYGIIPGLIKYILKDVNIITLLLFEAIGVLTFTAIGSLFHIENISKDLQNITWRTSYSIILLCLVVFIANILLYLVLFRYDSYIVSAVISSSPIFSLLASFLFIKESVTFIHLLGVGLIVGGVWCISA